MIMRESKIDIINNGISDGKYFLDDSRPYKAILKVLFCWILSILIKNLILYPFFTISQANEFFGTVDYYIIYDISSIFFEWISLFIYIYLYFKTESTLKERDFLKLFSIVPIGIGLYHIFSFIVVLYPIDYLFNIFYSIPLDIILTIIGLCIIYTYFKNKSSLIFAGIVFVSMFLQILVNILIPAVYVVETLYIKTLYTINNIFVTMNMFQFWVIVPFLAVLFLIKRNYPSK